MLIANQHYEIRHQKSVMISLG